MKIRITREQLEKAFRIAPGRGSYFDLGQISGASTPFPDSLEVEMEEVETLPFPHLKKMELPEHDPTICRTLNCKRNHVRVCNAIECDYQERQPHLHHSPKIEEPGPTQELAQYLVFLELIRRENARNGY